MSNNKNSVLATTTIAPHKALIEWKIENFSLFSSYTNSPDFNDDKGNHFALGLKPNENETNFLSLEMRLKENQDLSVKYKLSIQSNGKKLLLFDGTDFFESEKTSFESNGDTEICRKNIIIIRKFLSCADLQEPSKGYLLNDTLIIYCEISHTDNENTFISLGTGPSQIETTQKAMEDYGSLLKSGTLADVKLLVGGKSFSGHKSILAARSPRFAAIFAHDTKEKQEDQVEIRNVEPVAFVSLLEFLYTGAMPTLGDIKSAKDLFLAAANYACEQLMAVCENYLISQLTIETASDLNHFATSVNALKLEECSAHFLLL